MSLLTVCITEKGKSQVISTKVAQYLYGIASHDPALEWIFNLLRGWETKGSKTEETGPIFTKKLAPKVSTDH